MEQWDVCVWSTSVMCFPPTRRFFTIFQLGARQTLNHFNIQKFQHSKPDEKKTPKKIDKIQTIKHKNVRQAPGTGNHQMQPETSARLCSMCVQCVQQGAAVEAPCQSARNASYKNVTINTQMPRRTRIFRVLTVTHFSVGWGWDVAGARRYTGISI